MKNIFKAFLCFFIVGMMLVGCTSVDELYYTPRTEVPYRLDNAQRIKGERCFYQEPRNAIVTEFFDDILLEAALVPSVIKTSSGKKKLKSTVLFIWVWAREPVRFEGNKVGITINNTPQRMVTLAVDLQRPQRLKYIDPLSSQAQRRPHIKGEGRLAVAEGFLDLDVVKPETVDVSLPPVRSGARTVELPVVSFTRMYGADKGIECSL